MSEPDPALQAFALERLNSQIDAVWTEVSGSIGQMYVLRVFTAFVVTFMIADVPEKVA